MLEIQLGTKQRLKKKATMLLKLLLAGRLAVKGAGQIAQRLAGERRNSDFYFGRNGKPVEALKQRVVLSSIFQIREINDYAVITCMLRTTLWKNCNLGTQEGKKLTGGRH